MLAELYERFINWYANLYVYMDTEYLDKAGKYDYSRYY